MPGKDATMDVFRALLVFLWALCASKTHVTVESLTLRQPVGSHCRRSSEVAPFEVTYHHADVRVSP
jgi:hypothetical protein